MEASEPKLVKSMLNVILVNSFRGGGLQIRYVTLEKNSKRNRYKYGI